MKRPLTALALLLMLAACGQTGPLRLPTPPATEPTAEPAAATPPAAEAQGQRTPEPSPAP